MHSDRTRENLTGKSDYKKSEKLSKRNAKRRRKRKHNNHIQDTQHNTNTKMNQMTILHTQKPHASTQVLTPPMPSTQYHTPTSTHATPDNATKQTTSTTPIHTYHHYNASTELNLCTNTSPPSQQPRRISLTSSCPYAPKYTSCHDHWPACHPTGFGTSDSIAHGKKQ